MSILFIKLTTLLLPLLSPVSEGLMPLMMRNMLLRQLRFQPSQNPLNLIHQKVQCSINAAKWIPPYRLGLLDPSSGSPNVRMTLMTMHPHRWCKAMQLHPRPPSTVLHLYGGVRTVCVLKLCCFLFPYCSIIFQNVQRDQSLNNLIMIGDLFIVLL